jgi:hypothetical protein
MSAEGVGQKVEGSASLSAEASLSVSETVIRGSSLVGNQTWTLENMVNGKLTTRLPPTRESRRRKTTNSGGFASRCFSVSWLSSS